MDGRRHGQGFAGAGRNCIPRASSIGFADDAQEVTMELHGSGEDAALSALNDELEGLHLEGHWRLSGAVLGAEPRPVAEAHLWRWADIRRLLVRAGELRAIDGGAGRRTVRLCTPGLAEKWATRTIHASFQLVKPGETAEAHRHTLGALRFVVEGSGGHTTVEGEKFVMEPGDLVLTPQNTWHDHGNAGDAPMIWIDGHDGPLTLGLNALFMEPYSAETQPVLHDDRYTTRRTGAMRPRGVGPRAGGYPYIYKGREALALLADMGPADWDPCEGFILDYVDPVTGGYTMPTIACRLHGLPIGISTRRQRETSSRIYHVVRGTGSTVAGVKTLNWLPGDAFVVPGWCWSEHRASDDAVLFEMSDEPVLRATSLYRCERSGENREPGA
jgi:gentisate 1,2-dioxygenase